MYDIITTTPEDQVVKVAINTIVEGKVGIVPPPAGNYILTVGHNTPHKEGNGGEHQKILVIVGHGSPTGLSGIKTWSLYKEEFSSINWKEKSSVYVLACSTAGDPDPKKDTPFLYQHFAEQVKKDKDLHQATVWASSSAVHGGALTGEWQKIVG